MPDINIMPALPKFKSNPQDIVRKILTEETYATVMLVLFIDSIGDEQDEGKDIGLKALQWHPQVIKEHLENHWGVQLPIINFDKLMAAITIVTTDLFFTNLDGFIKLCNVLAGNEFEPRQFVPVDSLECAWGCTEALLLDPPDEENPEPFADEIRHFITHVLTEEGYISPPDILRIAIDADFSSQVKYDFTEDPGMFENIWNVQQGKKDDVESVLHGNLLELLGQLQVLPLKHGSMTIIEKHIGDMLRKTGKVSK